MSKGAGRWFQITNTRAHAHTRSTLPPSGGTSPSHIPRVRFSGSEGRRAKSE